MDIIFLVIFLGFLVQSILWCSHLAASFDWLRHNYCINGQMVKKEVVVLIPALDEVKRLPETINYFLKKFIDLDLKILVITTEKEYKINNKKSLSFSSLGSTS